MSISVLESVWIALNLSTLILTVSFLLDALADRSAVRRLNGQARELAAAGIVRREAFKVAVQALLLSVVVPGALTPGEPTLSFTVGALMSISVLLLASSLLDARERKAMTILVAVEMLGERTGSLARVEAQNAGLAEAVADNTRISQAASDHADHAYREANSVNEKIAAQGAALLAQGESAAEIAATVEDTHTKVDEIHRATVEP